MNAKIVDASFLATADDRCRFLNGGHEVFISDLNLRVNRWSGTDSWKVTDIKDALAAGKICVGYGISRHYANDSLAATNFICSRFNGDMKALFDFCDGLGWVDGDCGYGEKEVTHDKYTVYITRYENKAIRVFSPFALERMKPLKEAPKKWTVTHALRALINGQYKSLHCNGVYTDDYAYDAAVNFRQGEIADAVAFASKIIASPEGWWVGNYRGNNEVSICCHHFDSNSFVFDLNPVKEKPAPTPSPSRAKSKAKVIPFRRAA